MRFQTIAGLQPLWYSGDSVDPEIEENGNCHSPDRDTDTSVEPPGLPSCHASGDRPAIPAVEEPLPVADSCPERYASGKNEYRQYDIDGYVALHTGVKQT